MAHAAPICAAEVVVRIVRGRWALALVATVAERQPIHFAALSRAIDGMSRKVLTEQLRFFQHAGVIARTTSPGRQEVTYTLTERGRELKKAIDGLNSLAARWDTL